jgi:hypothetical protein
MCKEFLLIRFELSLSFVNVKLHQYQKRAGDTIKPESSVIAQFLEAQGEAKSEVMSAIRAATGSPRSKQWRET